MEDHPRNMIHKAIKKTCHFLSLLKSREKTGISDWVRQKKGMLIISIIILLIIVVGSYFLYAKEVTSHAVSSRNKIAFDEKDKKNVRGSQPLVQQLNDIAIKMASIEHHLAADPLVYIEKVQADLGHLKQEAAQLAAESRQMISNQIQQSTVDLTQHLTVMNARLEKLEQEKKQAVYLQPSNLPFQIQHIDNIQQHNVVTVYYDNTTFPLDIGDYLASWKLIAADFSRQKAEFMNNKQQYVVVDLNQVNEKKG
jgi:hypothetical protein